MLYHFSSLKVMLQELANVQSLGFQLRQSSLAFRMGCWAAMYRVSRVARYDVPDGRVGLFALSGDELLGVPSGLERSGLPVFGRAPAAHAATCRGGFKRRIGASTGLFPLFLVLGKGSKAWSQNFCAQRQEKPK